MLKSSTSFIVCFLLGLSAFAQTKAGVDSLVKSTITRFKNSAEPKPAITDGFKIVEQAEILNYDKGIVKGFTIIAEALSLSAEYEKSVLYINKIQQYHSYLSEHPLDEFNLLMLQVNNYKDLGFDSLVKVNFYKAERVIKKIDHKNDRHRCLIFLYMSSELISEDPDTLYYYSDKARNILNSPDYFDVSVKSESDRRQQQILNQALLSISFGKSFFGKKNIDSAQVYYNDALTKLRSAGSNHYYEFYAYDGLSNIYESIADYPKAIDYQQKAMDISEQYGQTESILTGYNALSRLYALSGNLAKKQEYAERYALLADSIEKEKKQGRDRAVINLVEQKEAELNRAQQQSRSVMMGITAGILAMLAILYILFHRYKRKKSAILVQKETQLDATSQKLSRVEQETQLLNQEMTKSAEELKNREEEIQALHNKVNESFDNLLELAKENNPNFYVRFQEVYPELHQKLLKLTPDLQSTELTLCAYIYLDFSTKDIAEYTFKSHRTIQNRKNSLRKRLGIDSSEDLYIWFKNL